MSSDSNTVPDKEKKRMQKCKSDTLKGGKAKTLKHIKLH
jgi:hypothetical protein